MRRVRLVVLLILFAAAVNIIVAWRFTQYASLTGEAESLPRGEVFELWRQHGGERRLGGTEGWAHERWGLRSRILWSGAEDPPPFHAVTIVDAGWPLRSLQGVIHHLEDFQGTRREVVAMYELPLIPLISSESRRYLPIRPLWFGFLFNTLFYAGLFAGGAAGVGAWRRRIRLDRGECPRCRYRVDQVAATDDVVTCPECGTQIQATSLTRPRQLGRVWMIPLLLPAVAIAALWFFGVFEGESLRIRLTYDDPPFSRTSLLSMLIGGAWLLVICEAAYRDRTGWQRHLLAAAVAFVLTITSFASIFILILRLRT